MCAMTDDPWIIPINCAPRKSPCPHCGTPARRKRTCFRQVRTIAYKRVALLDITYGEYQARCSCCATFRTCPAGVLPKHFYDNKVRQAVLDLILDSKLNVEATIHLLRRDFLLDLSTGFVYDCLADACRQLDLAEYRQQVIERFSGTLCIDEVHLGDYTLLLATDPLGDFPVAFALVSKNDQDHLRRFLGNLKSWGLLPRVVVTDGSNLYPALLAQLWPRAEHQLCVFHIIKDINEKTLEALKRLRRQKSRQGNRGRKRKRGRPRRKANRRRKLTAKEKAHFVFKKRHLMVKRQEEMTRQEKKELVTMLEYIPQLRVLRQFSDAIYRLLSDGQDEGQAHRRWRWLHSQEQFQAVPELAKALEMLRLDQFDKVIAFLRSPQGQRVRTNNHVERINRKLRYWEKVRYKWRKRRSLVRFLVLALARMWDEAFLAERSAKPAVATPTASPQTASSGSTP
jgi:Transposase